MKYSLRIKSACLCLGLLFSIASPAEPLASRSVASVLTAQMFQKGAEELRNMCAKQYPNLQAQLAETYSSSPLTKTVVSIRVNGQEFQVKEIDEFIRDLRESFSKQDEVNKLEKCAGYGGVLAQWAYIKEHAQELGQQAQEHIDLAAKRKAKQAEPPLP